MPVERQLPFQAQRIARAQSAGHDAEFLTRFQHLVPHSGAGGLVGGDVDLEAIFGRVSGAGNQNVAQPCNCSVGEPIELHLRQVGVGQLLQGVDALRPLDRDLGKVVAQVLDLAIELLGVFRDPVDVFLAGAGIDHQHVVFFAHAVHDDVIDKRPFGIKHGRIAALANAHARRVVHSDALHRLQRLRPRDADVAHVADIEDAHAVAHRQVLLHQAAHRGIFHRHVPAVEVDHLRAHLAMDRIQGSLANGCGHLGVRRQMGILWRTERAVEVGTTKYGTMRDFQRSTEAQPG